MKWISPKYLKGAKSIEKPFLHFVLKDFFVKNKIEAVRKALLQHNFEQKNADLFSFQQTQEIKQTDDLILQEFYKFFGSGEFRDYVGRLTKTKLKSIDMSGFIYSSGDYLLPHDDRLETRKVAYVVNLSKDFTKKDGGALDLFTTKKNHPQKIAKSYTPAFNTLFLFKVTRKSFHQVNEVLSNKKRLTLTGWFHD